MANTKKCSMCGKENAMKTKLLWFLLGVMVLSSMGALGRTYLYNLKGERVNPGEMQTLQDDWETLGTFASATTTPNATHRTAAAFIADAKNVAFEIPAKWNTITIRCSSTTDGDSSVFDIFLMKGETDHFSRIGTLTFTTGSQTATASGYVFADTLAETNEKWHKASSELSPVGNYIAEWMVDHLGSFKVGVSPTTITNTAILDIIGS